eukprot:Nk52_evm1s1861 gene=Nk52_evmTU1s1861
MVAQTGNSNTEENLPWVEKYRPKEFDDLISHQEIVSTITRFIDENRLPHLLLYGPPGTGKTSTILACARKLYGPKYKSMILELNASDDRGINVVRDQIKDFASTRKMFSSGFKLIILDEADAMTNAAQAALRRVIEKYTQNCRFCIICNYIIKIIPALQSRCTKFRFAPLSREQMSMRLDHVITEEKIDVTAEGKEALLKLSNGDMRKVLNVAQSAAMAYEGKITEDDVYHCTGHPLPNDIANMVSWMLNDSVKDAYQKIEQLQLAKGLAIQDIVTEVHAFIERIDFPNDMRIYILDHLAELEHRISAGTSEKVQLGALVGTFYMARTMV